MTTQLARSTPDRGRPGDQRPPRYDRALLVAIAATVLVLIGLGIYLAVRAGSADGGFQLGDTSTSTTSASTAPDATLPSTTTAQLGQTSDATATGSTDTIISSTTIPSTTTASIAVSTSTTPVGSFRSDVIWPDPAASTGFATAIDAARSFAVDLAGFSEPVVGPFTDELDGAVELRPSVDGPVTMVLVRQDHGDGSWRVTAAYGGGEIGLDNPAEGDTVTGALHLVGQARAFEGQVDVALYLDGTSDPIVEGVVMGRGDGVLGDFDKTFDLPPDAAGHGVLLLTAPGAQDGAAWAVLAIPLTIG